MPTGEKKSAAPAAPALAGVSADLVRSFLLQVAELGSWTAVDVQKALGVDAVTARGVVGALSIVGYIELDPDDPKRWRNTEAGNTMAGVSRAKPMTRKRADKAIAAFKERVREVNMESRFLYRVEKAVIFGPYLTGAEKMKNVDIAVDLRPKIQDREELERRVKADAERAEAEGKRFKSFADRRGWGENKVREHLRQRTRAIELHVLADGVLKQPHRALFPRSRHCSDVLNGHSPYTMNFGPKYSLVLPFRAFLGHHSEAEAVPYEFQFHFPCGRVHIARLHGASRN